MEQQEIRLIVTLVILDAVIIVIHPETIVVLVFAMLKIVGKAKRLLKK